MTSPKKIKLDKRRKRVLELRVDQKMSVDEIREAVLAERDEFLEPDIKYTTRSVLYDLQISISAIHEQIKNMATAYVGLEIEKLAQKEDRVSKALDLLYSKIEYFNEDTETYEIQQATNAIVKVEELLLKIMDQRAKYLPLFIQKDSGTGGKDLEKWDLDSFNQMRAKAEANKLESGE